MAGYGFGAAADTISGFIKGRNTPMADPISEEEKARLLERYVRTLKELDVAESNIKKEAISTWGNMRVALIGARAQTLAAEAQGAMAGAQGAQAAAALAEVYLKTNSGFLAEHAAMMPDEKASTEIATAGEAALKAGRGEVKADALVAKLAGAQHGDTTTPAAQAEYARNAQRGVHDLLAGTPALQKYLTDQNTALNAMSSDDPKQAYTAIAQEATIRKTVWGIMAAKEQEAGVEPGTFTGHVDSYMKEYIRPAFTGQIERAHPGTIQKAMEVSTAAAEELSNLHNEVVAVQNKYGIPAAHLKQAYASMNTAEAAIRDPSKFAQSMADMPSPMSFADSRALIKRQIDRLETPWEDPLNKAVRKWHEAVPNSDAWTAAMDFPSVERAAIYGAQHMDEVKHFVTMQDRDPGIVDDVAGLRRGLAQYGLEQQRRGADPGYFTTRLERTLGLRVPSREDDKAVRERMRLRDAAAPRPDVLAGAGAGLPDGPTEPSDGGNAAQAARTIIDAAGGDRAKVSGILARMDPADPAQAAVIAELRGFVGGGAGADLPDAGGREMLVYTPQGVERRKVTSPHLDTTEKDGPSRVVQMGDGYAYQELFDGSLIILESPAGNAGATIRPGEPHWRELNEEVSLWMGRPGTKPPSAYPVGAPLDLGPIGAPAAPVSARPARSAPRRAAPTTPGVDLLPLTPEDEADLAAQAAAAGWSPAPFGGAATTTATATAPLAGPLSPAPKVVEPARVELPEDDDTIAAKDDEGWVRWKKPTSAPNDDDEQDDPDEDDIGAEDDAGFTAWKTEKGASP